MKISKKLVFYSLFLGFLVSLPTSNVSADSGRYFVKSTKSFWKNALGARNVFSDGFTTDLSDFQVRFTKIFGVETEPVKALQILPSNNPTPTQFIPAKSVKTKRGTSRLLPSERVGWGLRTIYNDNDLVKSSGGQGISVAVLDTGVNINHPDLKNRISDCKDFSSPKNSVIDDKCEDNNGHGTHVAGIVAADSGDDGLGIFGVAPQASLLTYKVCGANGSCFADDVATAIRTAADAKTNIINMSFGSDSDIPMVKDAINYAVSKGSLLVAAAGNDGPFEASIDYPAAYSSVLAVSAVGSNFTIPEWSSRGINSDTQPNSIEDKDIEFATPGENIESTWNNGGYVILSGTSMSAPFVSGLAAKYWQNLDSKPAEATRSILKNLVKDIGPEGEDNLSGYGLPQVK